MNKYLAIFHDAECVQSADYVIISASSEGRARELAQLVAAGRTLVDVSDADDFAAFIEQRISDKADYAESEQTIA